MTAPITEALRAEIIRRVDEAPPLREEQRETLRRLLASAPVCAAVAARPMGRAA